MPAFRILLKGRRGVRRYRLFELTQGACKGKFGWSDHQGLPGIARIAAQSGKRYRYHEEAEPQYRGNDPQRPDDDGIGRHCAGFDLRVIVSIGRHCPAWNNHERQDDYQNCRLLMDKAHNLPPFENVGE
jgi:hypothetical protein